MKLLTPGYALSKAIYREPSEVKMIRLMIILLMLCAFSFLPSATIAQTLFTYGNHKVSKDEFLKAYNKNNNDSTANNLSYDEYLELYLRFRLKVQAAFDAGLDTTEQQKAELKSFRYQLAENYLKDEAAIPLLVDEAFERLLKDIHLSHIFVPVGASASTDSVNAARKRIDEAYARLQKDESFDQVASSYLHRSLGYITAFVLPYEPESIAYTTPVGKHSVPFKTNSGFNIIRNDGERKAVGTIRAAQILLAFPPDATAEIKQSIKERADSVYGAIKSGADFAQLARDLSDDHLTFQNGGEMPPFGVGQYDTAFEQAAFALENDGDITKPIETNFGFHIIKRLQRIPVIEDRNNTDWMEMIREKVMQSDRMQVANNKLIQNIKKKIQNDAGAPIQGNDSAVLDYYRNHLEKYDKEFGEQLNEFREGNMLFTMMQEKVWDAAAKDTSGLISFYNRNRNKYMWENSADALIITCLVADSVESTIAALRRNYKNWRQIVENGNGIIQADSGRFDLGQVPVVEKTNFTEGLITAPLINEQDSSRTFAYIIRLYTSSDPKSFQDARGAVTGDYQNYLEERWISELKKKYPVKVNRKVLRKIKEKK